VRSFKAEVVRVLTELVELPERQILDLVAAPPKEEMGDFAFPCFTLAKSLGKKPVEIASDLAARLQPGNGIERVVSMGPYVNFWLDRTAFIAKTLEEIVDQGERFGSEDQGRGKTVVIDYSSPNLAKQFSIAHLRSTAIGNSIYRIYAFLGWKCVGVNHLGDWGGNFGQLLAAYRKWANPEAVKANPLPEFQTLYARFNQELEHNQDLKEQARQCARELEAGDPETESLWRFFVEESRKEADRIYAMLDVRFDESLGESFFAAKLDEVVELFEAAGLARESEGALIVDLEDFDMPPCILRTSRGTSTYHSRDLAALLHRRREYDFDRMVYVTDSRQSLHFRQLFKAMELLGEDWFECCQHAAFGLLSFKGAKMSTRAGHVIFLERVLDEAIELTSSIVAHKNPGLESRDQIARQVGISAIIFADLDSRRTRDIVFDWKEALNFDGETGPYLQYTHARFCSIIRRYGKAVGSPTKLDKLGAEAEMRVARQLAEWPDTVARACDENEPSLVATFLLELATVANKFYNELPVLNHEDQDLVAARIILVDCVRTVLRTGLGLLGMSAPEEM
jgi:arginyl-tRNA synthetase